MSNQPVPGGRLELSGLERARFKEIMQALGLSQKETAPQAGVTEAWLSNLLTGNRKRLKLEMIAKVADFLLGVLWIQRAEGGFARHEERAAEDADFLKRFSAERTRSVHPPGGMVPLDADHYIQREGKPQLSRFSYAVQIFSGPPQVGISSALARYEAQALTQGRETLWFDGYGWDSQKLPGALAEQMCLEWELPKPHQEINSLRDLRFWITKSLKQQPKRELLLVVDDIASLGDMPQSENVITQWKSFAESIQLHCARERLNLHVAIALPYIVWGNPSSEIIPQIEIEWFTLSECRTLSHQLGKDWDPKIYAHAGGQPYLTHAAIADPTFTQALANFEESPGALKRFREYTVHCHSLAKALATVPNDCLEILAGNNLETLQRMPRNVTVYLEQMHIMKRNDVDEVLDFRLPVYKMVVQNILHQRMKRGASLGRAIEPGTQPNGSALDYPS